MQMSTNVRPPAPPWKELEAHPLAGGFLSYYYSDPLSRLPVREVTRPHDNKSDPNFETGTFGLFSTCERSMRSGVVKRGTRYLFFVTRYRGERVVSGYYRLKWYADGVFSGKKSDPARAADLVKFVATPIALSDLVVRGVPSAASRFRTMKLLDDAEVDILLGIIDELPDATDEFVDEVRRLERFQRFHSGYGYVSWGIDGPFDWSFAEKYLVPDNLATTPGLEISNASPSGFWKCEVCNKYVRSNSLLKFCRFCEAVGSLRPVSEREANASREDASSG